MSFILYLSSFNLNDIVGIFHCEQQIFLFLHCLASLFHLALTFLGDGGPVGAEDQAAVPNKVQAVANDLPAPQAIDTEVEGDCHKVSHWQSNEEDVKHRHELNLYLHSQGFYN